MISTFKDKFLELLEEENVAGGANSVFGSAVAANGGIYNPNEGRITSNDNILASKNAVLPKALGGVQRRAGISKRKRRKRKKND